ncbi:MAG TPA: phage holin family protein [Actinophytocola sp.]|jgi:membrane protein|nr:phage holin family protein [Actinophytocola sp.]
MGATPDPGAGTPVGEKSTAELVHDLTEQFSHLARTEIRLAVREVADKAKHAGIGAANLGAAGVLGGYGLAIVLAGVVLLVALVLPAWAAALIVGGVLLLIAGVAVFVARGQLRKSTPPVPTEAVADAKKDIQVVKEAVRR